MDLSEFNYPGIVPIVKEEPVTSGTAPLVSGDQDTSIQDAENRLWMCQEFENSLVSAALSSHYQQRMNSVACNAEKLAWKYQQHDQSDTRKFHPEIEILDEAEKLKPSCLQDLSIPNTWETNVNIQNEPGMNDMITNTTSQTMAINEQENNLKTEPNSTVLVTAIKATSTQICNHSLGIMVAENPTQNHVKKQNLNQETSVSRRKSKVNKCQMATQAQHSRRGLINDEISAQPSKKGILCSPNPGQKSTARKNARKQNLNPESLMNQNIQNFSLCKGCRLNPCLCEESADHVTNSKVFLKSQCLQPLVFLQTNKKADKPPLQNKTKHARKQSLNLEALLNKNIEKFSLCKGCRLNPCLCEDSADHVANSKVFLKGQCLLGQPLVQTNKKADKPALQDETKYIRKKSETGGVEE